MLADTKCTFFDVHFWVNAHRCAPGPFLSCTSLRTISDGSHGKAIFTPVPSWANRPWQTSQVACCCPVSRRPGAVGLCSGAKGAGSSRGLPRFGAAPVPCWLCGCCSCTSWLLLLSRYLFPSPAPLPPCYGGVFASLPALSNASCMLRLIFFI